MNLDDDFVFVRRHRRTTTNKCHRIDVTLSPENIFSSPEAAAISSTTTTKTTNLRRNKETTTTASCCRTRTTAACPAASMASRLLLLFLCLLCPVVLGNPSAEPTTTLLQQQQQQQQQQSQQGGLLPFPEGNSCHFFAVPWSRSLRSFSGHFYLILSSLSHYLPKQQHKKREGTVACISLIIAMMANLQLG